MTVSTIIQPKTSIGASSLGWLVLIALALCMWLGIRELARRPAAARLPDLPDLKGKPTALVEHLRFANRTARRNPTDAEAVGALGMAYHSDGSYGKAIQCYRQAQDQDPSDWRWAYYRSLLEEELGNSGAVVEILETVLSMKRDLPVGWYRLGKARFKLRHFEAAGLAYQQAVSGNTSQSETDPADPPGQRFSIRGYASLGLARVALIQERTEDAQRMLEELIERSPEFGPAHSMLGRVYLQLERQSESRKHHKLAHEIPNYFSPPDPLLDALIRQSHSSPLLRKYAQDAQSNANVRRAQFLARLAMQLNQDDADEAEKLGRLLFDLDLKQEALPYLRRHVEAKGTVAHVKTMHRYGACLVQTGQLEEGEAFLRQSIALHPKSHEFQCELGLLFATQHKHEEAIDRFHLALKLEPDYAKAHNGLGNSLGALGHIDQAIDHYRHAVAANPDFAPGHYNLGHALRVTGKSAGALNHFRELSRLERKNPDPLNSMAWILATDPDPNLRNPTEAIELAIRAAELTKYQNVPILDTLAAAHAASGAFDRAVVLAKKAIDLAVSVEATELASSIRRRLGLYVQAKSYQRTVPGGGSTVTAERPRANTTVE